MASPAPSRPTPREPDRRRCRRPPPTPQLQVAHPPGEPPNSSFLSPSRQFPPIRRHRAIIQLPDLGLEVRSYGVSFTLEHAQIVGWLNYGWVATGRPDKIYGPAIKSNYHGQGVALAREAYLD